MSRQVFGGFWDRQSVRAAQLNHFPFCSSTCLPSTFAFGGLAMGDWSALQDQTSSCRTALVRLPFRSPSFGMTRISTARCADTQQKYSLRGARFP